MRAFRLRIRPYRPLVLRCAGPVLAGLLAVSAAYADVANPAFPAHPGLATRYDCPQDAVSGLVQYLFPSPDGLNLVPNERDNDPIGLIAREQRGLPAPTTGLRKLMALLDAADAYRVKLQSPSPATEAGEAFKDAVRRILAPAVGVKEHGSRKKNYEWLRKSFAERMQQALLEEIRDKEDRYPPRIVETALLAYAWLVADSPAELQAALPGLFQPPGSHRVGDQGGLPPVEAKAAGGGPDPVVPGSSAALRADPAADFLAVLQRLRVSSPTPAFLDMGQAYWNGSAFPDCGETSLRNFFLAMLWTWGNGLDPQRIADLESRLAVEVKDVALGPAQVRFERLIRFFKDHPSLAAQGSRACRDEWAAIVSGVNLGEKDPLPVPYRTAGSCNLAGEGVEAMLNLVAHLLPDPGLNAPWPEPGPARFKAIAGKLDRLCALFPRGPLKLDWDAGEGKELVGRYATLTFSIEKNRLFTWDFRDRHYDLTSCQPEAQHDAFIESLAATSDDYWVKAIAWPAVVSDRYPLRITRPNERFYYSHVGPGAAKLLRALDINPLKADWRLISLLVHRELPRSIADYQELASLYARARHSGPFVIPGLRDISQADRNQLLAESLQVGTSPISRMLIDHGSQVDARDGQDTPMVHLAAARMGEAGLLNLLALAEAGVDFQARDARGRTALHVAAERGNLDAVKLMLWKGLDPFEKDHDGITPMALARGLGSPLFLDLPPGIRVYLELLEHVVADRRTF